ncbi:signal peptidase [Azospirillum thiophilum]|uniref:Signal peptidase I n=1 Tax=Azospirillum thiophilum TaxID=528244 RepID=A0AAC8ZU46_9PROT|nr:signal peptidase I [Azospirillum thiophilum]ALG71230.1 signal peptidase [Azospirillum thiophilum]KJR65115.1 signal peptidase [Azospirillum thiophilum]
MTFHKQAASDAKTKDSGFVETVKTVIFAVLIAFGVRTFAFEPFNIPSGSMIPTLLVGDYLFVSKFSYGYSKYTVGFGLPLFEGRILGSQPERGDVAVFKLPRDNKTDYIKRVIGLPGDSIQMIGGILHINGQPVKRERIEDFVTTDSLGRSIRTAQFIETLPNGRTHRIIEESDNGPLDNTPVFKVPENHLFMMGDNRDNSLDSRVPSQVGFVPIENMVGRAEFLFFSLDEGTRFYEIWRWPVDLRFSRLFNGVR